MASPHKLSAKLCPVSPRALKTVGEFRRFLSPRTPVKDIGTRTVDNENRLSPFNIDTPNRMKILQDGLPSKHRTVLGCGGFGTVYKASYKGNTFEIVKHMRVLARHKFTGDQVAAKIMQAEKCTDSMINSEKRASLLRHSNIVRVLTVEKGASLSLITMELCGTTLQDCLDETVLPKDKRIRVLRDLTCALQFCHSAGIVHADVKPKNILMTADGQPKLTDFGSSVLIGEPHETVEFHGTPGYVAPEVLKGDIPSSAADIYSLGVVAWQMVSRSLPFAGLHFHTVIYLTAKGSRPADDEIEDGFSGIYKTLYRKMWSQNIMDRPEASKIIEVVNTLCIQ